MTSSYGSHRNGLICGFRFTPGFIWLHFNLGDAGAEGWKRRNLAVVPELFDALREGSRDRRARPGSVRSD